MSKPTEPSARGRREFLKKGVAASAGAALAFGFEEKSLLAQAAPTGQAPRAVLPPKEKPKEFPTGKIGDMKISRLICGGNLISGFAHSRDLIYVSGLLKRYFTDEKVFETLRICENNGINTAILRVDNDTIRILNTYWHERDGEIQWIAQAKMKETDIAGDIDRAVDNGAASVYIHGGVCDSLVSKKKVDLLGKALERIRLHDVPAGIAGHSLDVPKACEKAGLSPDFYMKTINSKQYWSAGPVPRKDSVWAETPKETIEFMKGVEKPWIGYKILGAGAIHPTEGFKYAFGNGADFICVGMFDYQIDEDVGIAKRVLAGLGDRPRPWRA